MDWRRIPLLVSCPNGGGLVLVLGEHSFILERRDSTGLVLKDDGWMRVTVNFPNCVLHIESDNGPTKRFCFEAGMDDIHDILCWGKEILAVSTSTNEIAGFDQDGKLVRRVSFPGEGDAWHLNCLAIWDGKVVVSAFGEFSTHRRYKGETAGAGFLFDLETRTKLWEGLSQPHTPLQADDTYYICDSETCRVLWRRGERAGNIQFDAYTRGLAVTDEYLFVGLSQSRNIKSDKGNASIAVLSRADHRQLASLHLPFGEIYAVAPLTDLDERRWMSLLGIASNQSELFQTELSKAKEELQVYAELYTGSQAELDRLNRHPIVGNLIKLLRLLKRDRSFGQGTKFAPGRDGSAD